MQNCIVIPSSKITYLKKKQEEEEPQQQRLWGTILCHTMRCCGKEYPYS